MKLRMLHMFTPMSNFARLFPLLALMLLCIISRGLCADAPAWWAERGVINLSTAATPDDYAAVNEGQLKNIAKQAYEVMKARGLINPNDTTNRLVQTWEFIDPAIGDDYAAVNIGQLKNVAAPFYDLFISLGARVNYPWVGSPKQADDYALANIGQVKNLFSFSITLAYGQLDLDGSGLPDQWELYYFGHVGVDPNADPDGDGLSNLEEYQSGTDPLTANNPIVSLTLFSPSAH